MRKISLITILFAFSWMSYSQNLKPVVEVSSIYNSKIKEVVKADINMFVPDSLYKFDLQFDYSVFKKDYKGAYDFRPYKISILPQVEHRKDKILYLRAGAGYTFRPEFEFVYSPKLSKKYKLVTFANLSSFIGRYHIIKEKDAFYAFDKNVNFGFDIKSQIGLAGSYYGKKMIAEYGLDYNNFSRKYYNNGGLDVINADFAVYSRNLGKENSLYYKAKFHYNFAHESMKSNISLKENYWSALLALAYHKNDKSNMGLEIATEQVVYTTGTNFTKLQLRPNYFYVNNGWHINLGFKIAAIVDAKFAPLLDKSQFIYPDFHASLALIPEILDFYLYASGGEELNTYSTLVNKNHHFNFINNPFYENQVTNFDLATGLRGQFFSRFDYNLKAGFLRYANKLEFGLDDAEQFLKAKFLSYYKTYAEGNLNYTSRSFLWKTKLLFQDTNITKQKTLVFAPSQFIVSTKIEYNWHKRLFVGLGLEYATERKIDFGANRVAKIPEYYDLSVNAEYYFSPKMSLWLKGSNLLNQNIQKTPLHMDGGVAVSLGFSLSL